MEWATVIICPLLKKCDQTEYTNYRGISLLSCAYKLLSNIIFERILLYAVPSQDDPRKEYGA